RRAERDEKRLRDVHAILKRELRDLRVRQERNLALDLMREQRARVVGSRFAQTIGDLVRAEDDLIGVGIPKSAHAALGSRLRVGFIVAEQQPVGRLRLVQHVGAKLVPLRVVSRLHALRLATVPVAKAPSRDTANKGAFMSLVFQAPAKVNLTLE